MSGNRRSGNSYIPVSAENIDDSVIVKFEEGWLREMMVIWREKIEQMNIIDTGALYSSLQGGISYGTFTTIQHKFLEYGIYQAAGVGRGYAKGNNGNLVFLDESYREANGLDKPHKVGPRWGSRISSGNPRKRRDWFFRKYYASLMTLNDAEARLYGETYMGMVNSVIEEQFKGFAVKTK